MEEEESVCVRGGKKKMEKEESLPVELMREILLRLPVKSVLRFKCVCKSWLSLISEPQFGISHYDIGAAATRRVLLTSKSKSNSDLVYALSVDIEAPLNKESVPERFPLPTLSPPRNPSFQFHSNQPLILGSCRGLLLLYHETSADLILWNPSIRVYTRFPHFELLLTQKFLYGFLYDQSAHDYFLVLISFHLFSHALDVCKPQIQLFSFKTNSRTSLDISVPYKHLGAEFGAASLLNGSLHWLVFCQDTNIPVIVAFDLTHRTLSDIPLFHHFTTQNYQVYGLRVMRESLSLCCSVRCSSITEVWVMEQYKLHSSWTRSVVIQTYDIPHNLFSPICITKDGGIFGSNMRGSLEKRNHKGDLLEHLKCGRGQPFYKANLQVATYTESLVSLPSVIGAN
ncbi:hypothetical protein VNO78_14885 [Psophocarpus tetragonolobus]|uniref:F-box domain-containing protein n=1 Tax=Psophocarpus tetragonolobus TaxID=3891 RepID=A0AAN9SFE4_PSOTE